MVFHHFVVVAVYKNCFLLLNNVKCDNDWFVDVVSCNIDWVNVDAGEVDIPFVTTGIPLLSLFAGVVLRSSDTLGLSELNGKNDSINAADVPGVKIDMLFCGTINKMSLHG